MNVDQIVLNLGNDIVKLKKKDIVRLKYTSYLYEEFKDANYH